MELKQRQCLQRQRNAVPENVTGTNFSQAFIAGAGASPAIWFCSTTVVQVLHTREVIGSIPIKTTNQGNKHE